MATPMDEKTVGQFTPAQPSKKKQLVEVLVFLFLIFPSMVLSLLVTKQQGLTFPVVAVSTIVRDLALLSLVLYFLWSNKEPSRRIGLTNKKFFREVLIGLILYLPFFLLISLVETSLLQAGLSAPHQPLPAFLTAKGYEQYFLALVLVAVVAVCEEAIFRGYLILRFSNTIGNVLAAALLSAFIFSLGHGYEGSAGVITVGVMGFIFALVYLWRMSLVAPIVMHFIQDFIGIVLAPLFMK